MYALLIRVELALEELEIIHKLGNFLLLIVLLLLFFNLLD